MFNVGIQLQDISMPGDRGVDRSRLGGPRDHDASDDHAESVHIQSPVEKRVYTNSRGTARDSILITSTTTSMSFDFPRQPYLPMHEGRGVDPRETYRKSEQEGYYARGAAVAYAYASSSPPPPAAPAGVAPRSSSPPRTPYTARHAYGHAHIRTSPEITAEGLYRGVSEHADDPSSPWESDHRFSRNGAFPYKYSSSAYSRESSYYHHHQHPAPSFYPPTSDFDPSSDYSEDVDVDVDVDLPDVDSEHTSDSGPGQSEGIYSDSEEDGADDEQEDEKEAKAKEDEEDEEEEEEDMFSYGYAGRRRTFFHTSAERGQWKSNPMPFKPAPSFSFSSSSSAISILQTRKSVPSLSRVATPTMGVNPSRPISEPAPSTSPVASPAAFGTGTRLDQVDRSTHGAISATTTVISTSGAAVTPAIDASTTSKTAVESAPITMTSTTTMTMTAQEDEEADSLHTLPSLTSDRESSVAEDVDMSVLLSSPLPPSSPPLMSPAASRRSVSRMSRSISPLSFGGGGERSSSPLSEIPDDDEEEEEEEGEKNESMYPTMMSSMKGDHASSPSSSTIPVLLPESESTEAKTKMKLKAKSPLLASSLLPSASASASIISSDMMSRVKDKPVPVPVPVPGPMQRSRSVVSVSDAVPIGASTHAHKKKKVVAGSVSDKISLKEKRRKEQSQSQNSEEPVKKKRKTEVGGGGGAGGEKKGKGMSDHRKTQEAEKENGDRKRENQVVKRNEDAEMRGPEEEDGDGDGDVKMKSKKSGLEAGGPRIPVKKRRRGELVSSSATKSTSRLKAPTEVARAGASEARKRPSSPSLESSDEEGPASLPSSSSSSASTSTSSARTATATATATSAPPPPPPPKNSASGSSGSDPETAALHARICGLLIETMATSRASSLAVSALYKLVMEAQPGMKAERDKKEWMRLFDRVLKDGDAGSGGSGLFGKVESSGKDHADRPLEAQWFYVPELDEDQERAMVIKAMMPRPAKRSETKKYKQYYWQPLGKISKWDAEDDL